MGSLPGVYRVASAVFRNPLENLKTSGSLSMANFKISKMVSNK